MEYTYDHAGRMKTMKTWRNFASDTGAALTTWNYSAQRGFLLAKQYADGQGPTYTYTPAGRLATRTWARGITTYYAYNPAGQLTSETLATGLSITNTYDSLLRRSSLSAFHNSSFIIHTFSYDSASRLESVSDGTNTATYTYVANSPLVSQIAHTQSSRPAIPLSPISPSLRLPSPVTHSQTARFPPNNTPHRETSVHRTFYLYSFYPSH